VDKPVPTVDNTNPSAFSKLSRNEQSWLRRRRLWQAEWTTRDLPAGDVIFRLRARAKESQNRASVFLVLLFLSVSFGLTYFVLVPIYRDWVAKQANDERVQAEVALNAEAAEQSGEFDRIKSLAVGVALQTWRDKNRAPHLWAVEAVGETRIWIAGDHGTIVHSPDGGETWQTQSAGLKLDIYDIDFVDSEFGWAVGDVGFVMTTTDGGKSWSRRNLRTDFRLLDVHFADRSNGWIVGTFGNIWSTRNGGETWEQQVTNSDQHLIDIEFATEAVGWAVGNLGTILATQDGGATWIQQDSGTESHIYKVSVVDEKTAWVSGQNGTILSTDNNGQTWRSMQTASIGDLIGIDFLNADIGFLLNRDGFVSKTNDNGQSWGMPFLATDRGTIKNNKFNYILVAEDRSIWVVGSFGQIHRLGADGGVWQSKSLPPPGDPTPTTDWFGAPIQNAENAFELQTAIALADLNFATTTVLAAPQSEPSIDMSVWRSERREEETMQEDLGALVQAQSDLAERRVQLPVASMSLADEAVAAATKSVRVAPDVEARATAMALLDAALRQKAAEDVWWRNLDEQIPAGVLLLFLLATLGSLYRYNTRIAGFYHARADALELMALDDPPDMERFEALAGTLAADRVEFKAAKTPADMATEITKTVVSKLDLKPGK